MEPLPRSEMPHPASKDMDLMDPKSLARLFRAAEEEAREGLRDSGICETVAGLVASWIREPPRRIVLAGAGTSGRLAVLLARRHGPGLRRLGIELLPWIAGGSRALAEAVEGAEDDVPAARAGIGELLEIPGSVFFGISCGLSAPCVAGGLQAALEREAPVALFGVNTPEEARTDPLDGAPDGFRGLLARVEERGKFRFLLPDLGPEVLTGSSRLKGGTATWVLLHELFRSLLLPEEEGRPERIRARIDEAFRKAWGLLPEGWVAARIARAGEALRGGGRILCLGAGGMGRAAVLDASECPPTFGASPEEARAFLAGGWTALLGPAGDCAFLDRVRPLSLSFAERKVLPKTGEGDFVLRLGLPEGEDLPSSGDEDVDFLAAKFGCNAITTGAFARAGKVWGNRMVDLQLSNAKLFDRACRIVSDLCGVPEGEALRCLVGALHRTERPETSLCRLPVEAHRGLARPGVVPLAICLASGLGLEEAEALLRSEPILRRALAGVLHGGEGSIDS